MVQLFKNTLLERFSPLLFLCLADGERSKFLMRLLIVNPSPGILFAAPWHCSEICWPSTVTSHQQSVLCRLDEWMSSCNDPPTTQSLHHRRSTEVYKVGQCSFCQDMWTLISWVGLLFSSAVFCRFTLSTSPAASHRFWTDVASPQCCDFCDKENKKKTPVPACVTLLV